MRIKIEPIYHQPVEEPHENAACGDPRIRELAILPIVDIYTV
jgi:hypothetical protein